jgi:hypothetical protein
LTAKKASDVMFQCFLLENITFSFQYSQQNRRRYYRKETVLTPMLHQKVVFISLAFLTASLDFSSELIWLNRFVGQQKTISNTTIF